MKQRLEGLMVHHSIAYSRQTLGFEFSPEEAASLEGAVHPLIRENPGAHRKSLYLASHASKIIDWEVPDGRLLLRDLIEHATQPQFRYRRQVEGGSVGLFQLDPELSKHDVGVEPQIRVDARAGGQLESL
jgi:alpha-ketoglutarate-dependent taurine dioxygenase